MLPKCVVETMLKESDRIGEVESAATQIAMRFGDAGWYVGSELRKCESKNNADGLYAKYEDESESKGYFGEAHIKLDVASCDVDWLLIAE